MCVCVCSEDEEHQAVQPVLPPTLPVHLQSPIRSARNSSMDEQDFTAIRASREEAMVPQERQEVVLQQDEEVEVEVEMERRGSTNTTQNTEEEENIPIEQEVVVIAQEESRPETPESLEANMPEAAPLPDSPEQPVINNIIRTPASAAEQTATFDFETVGELTAPSQ